MRLLLYEKGRDMQLSKAHTDYEFLAILLADGPGLQIQHSDGSWFSIPHKENTGIVLPGDMLAVSSRNKIKATKHRVLFGDNTRTSIICFQGLKYQTPIFYPSENRLVPFGQHICGMKIRGTPHLEQALLNGNLVLSFGVPNKNPLSY